MNTFSIAYSKLKLTMLLLLITEKIHADNLHFEISQTANPKFQGNIELEGSNYNITLNSTLKLDGGSNRLESETSFSLKGYDNFLWNEKLNETFLLFNAPENKRFTFSPYIGTSRKSNSKLHVTKKYFIQKNSGGKINRVDFWVIFIHGKFDAFKWFENPKTYDPKKTNFLIKSEDFSALAVKIGSLVPID